MSKLPDSFVKAPPSKQTKSKARRTRKASLISPTPVKDPREVVVHLTEEEYQALEEARQKLVQGGVEITLEQMIHRVFAEWMLRARAALEPAPQPEPATAEAAPRDPNLLARLRAFVAAPLRTWRELAGAMWRVSMGRS